LYQKRTTVVLRAYNFKGLLQIIRWDY